MSKREAALAMGAADELGGYRRLAVPGSTVGDGFFIAVGVLMMGAASYELVHDVPRWPEVLIKTLCLVMGLGMAGLTCWPRFERRAGGPMTHLYCFEEGFVIAGRDSMRAVRWSHVTVTAERWESGTGDNRESGTRRTLQAPDGTVLVHFTGREPEQVGGYGVQLLHQAAVDREDTRPLPDPPSNDRIELSDRRKAEER
ncbi:hypothetical protein [Streptacidiphilus rugosus]|uniref:hypothetical protein n=1 Tax=Streptacidiphilus rugosus TaxID=405783 RepID=UPI00056D6922|nr:hypothetical protein [Streptacidiphilus rugosus]